MSTLVAIGIWCAGLLAWWFIGCCVYSRIDDDGALLRWGDEGMDKSWWFGWIFWTGWPVIAYLHWRDYTRPRRTAQ